MASVEDATRGERAAGRPCEPSLLGLFVLVTVMGEPAEFIRSAEVHDPMALLTHFGYWVQPPRRQATGPAPKPRWMAVPQLLYAQVVKTVRRRRLVRVRHRVVCGTLEAVQQVLAACGWQINTAYIERVNLNI